MEFPTPGEILRVRDEVSKADGIWIFTPEYNHSYPGGLKNLLDWLSRPVKKGGVKNRNRDRGEKGHDQRRWRKKRHSNRAGKIERTHSVYAGRCDGRMGDRCGPGWKRIWDGCPDSVGREQSVSSETGRSLPEVSGGLSYILWGITDKHMASAKLPVSRNAPAPPISICQKDSRRLERQKSGENAPKSYRWNRDAVSRAVADRRAYTAQKAIASPCW